MAVLIPSRTATLANRLITSLRATATTRRWRCLVAVDPEDRREDADQVLHLAGPPALYFRDAHDPTKLLYRGSWAINWLARQAADATHYWALNDDVVIHTRAWDERILTLEPGQLGMTDFTPDSGWHSNFPAFTRAHLDEFGTFFHANFWGWGADHWIGRTYALAGQARWLRIDLDHDQADIDRQRRIQQHQPPPPPNSEQQDWIRRIQAIAKPTNRAK